MARLSVPLAAFLLTALVRGVVALSRFDEYELDLYTGSFAWALCQGLKLHPEQWPIIAHLRGSVVFGVLLAPLFALFGPTLGVIKLFAVLWSALAAALFALVLQRVAGRRAAWIGALLIAFAPPSQQMVEVLALGSHADTLPFILGPLAVLLARPAGEPLAVRRSLALGLWLGLGSLFSMQTWVAYIGIFALWSRVDPDAWRRPRVAWIALGMAPGIAAIPWISRESKLVNRNFDEWLRIEAPLSKLANALVHELRDAWLFASRGVPLAGWVLFVALGAALAWILIRMRWRTLLPFGPRPCARDLFGLFAVAHIGVLFVAYALLDFHVNLGAPLDGMGSRYFMPLLPALMGVLVLGLDTLWRAHPRTAALALAGVMAALFAGVGTLIDPWTATRQPTVRGTEFHEFRGHLAFAAGLDRTKRVDLLLELTPDWPRVAPFAYPKLFQPFGPAFQVERARTPLTLQDLDTELAFIQREPAHVSPFTLLALGQAVGNRWADEAITLPGTPLAEIMVHRLGLAATRLAPVQAPWFARGVGRAAALQQGRFDLVVNPPGGPEGGDGPFAQGFGILARLPPALRTPTAEGMGAQWGLRSTPYERLTLRTLDSANRLLAPADVEPFFRGFGWAYRYRFNEEGYEVPKRSALEAHMAGAALEAFRRALGPGSGP